MLTLEVVNDGTGTDSSANYRYSVFINSSRIDGGRIFGHNRKIGCNALLSAVIEDINIRGGGVGDGESRTTAGLPTLLQRVFK